MAQVTYKISGKHDSAAIDQAKKGLQSLGEVANSVQNVFKGFLALKAVQAVSKVAADTVNAFKVQQTALATLSASIQNNSKLAEGSMQRLIKYSGELQKRSIYGDEELQKQASYLSSLQLSETEIRKVLNASVELASSGMMPLDSAVKNLAKTYGGMAGELGEKIPALRSLTKEQLASGAAIELVAKNFAGMTEAAVGTLAGSEAQVSNIVGDIKEKIGAVFGFVKTGALQFIKPYLEAIDAWLDVAKDKVINIFANLPELLNLVGGVLSTMLNNMFFWDYFYTLVTELGRYAWDIIKLTFSSIGPLVVDIFKEVLNWFGYIHYRLAKAFDWIGLTLKDVFLGVAESFVNAIINGINKAIEVANKIPGVNIGSLSNVSYKTNSASQMVTAGYDEWKNAGWSGALKGSGANATTQLSSLFSEGGKRFGEMFSNITSPLLVGTEGLTTRIAEIVNAPVLQNDFNPSSDGGAVISESTSSSSMGSLFGDMSPIKLLMDALSPLIDMFMGLNSIKMILDPLMIVFQGIFDVLAPIIDSLLRPIIGIFRIVGETIGKVIAPMLQRLSPLIELIAKAFVFLYNYAIKPLANTIIFISAAIYNGIAKVINGIIGWVDSLPIVSISWRMGYVDYESVKLQDISESDLNDAGTRAGVGSQSGGGVSASYSGQRDITNNFYIDIENINGNDREAALRFLEEIKSAISLGQASY